MRLESIMSRPVYFKERPGVISTGACHVIFWGEYMYCGETLPELLYQLVFKFADSSNFVGF